MAKITYIEASGTQHNVEVETGNNLMQGAVFNNIPGIDAECGGACVCATCHVYIDESWISKLSAAEDVEQMTLEEVDDLNERSRLSCQVLVDDSMDGMVVHLPASQG